MFSCFTEAELRQYVTGSLAAERHAGAAEHLRACPQCAERLSAIRDTPAELDSSRPDQWPTRADWAAESESSGSASLALGDVSSELSEPAMPLRPPAAAPWPVGLSLSEFLEHLSLSGLLPPHEIESVRGEPVADPQTGSTVGALIDWLIKQDKLTAYQADVVRRGLGAGLVLGNYVVLDQIGQGGMGTVFKARHRRMNRLVAIKVLPSSLSRIPEAIARFQREVEAAARLQHAHIASAYDADEAEGVHFLVMEYVDGPNLAAYVREKGPLPVAAAVRLVSQAAQALAAAHAQGIVHRDIKPSNLMVNRQGSLKLLDLGLAQMRGSAAGADLASEVTQTGRTMGTVDYMAPEQARDAKAVDARADIYSLGCTLFYLLVGRTPAPPGSAAEKLLWHQSQQAEALIDVCPGATAHLEALVARMMAKDPDDRPPSMVDVTLELDACLAEMPASTDDLSLDGIEIRPNDHSSTVHGSKAGHGTLLDAGDTLLSSMRPSAFDAAGPTKAQSRGRLVALTAGIVSLAMIVTAAAWPRLFGPSSPASERATLIVAASPAPAEVYVDGRVVGTVRSADQPLQLAIDPGNKTIAVRRRGYRDFEKAVQATAGKSVSVVAALERNEKRPLTSVSPAVASPHATYERLLVWIWQQGGAVEVKTSDGHTLNITALDQLPPETVDIVTIRLSGSGVRDTDLAHLKAAVQLVELSLADTRITDEGLANLAGLDQLTRLDLSKTGVKGPGLIHLGRMSRLTELNLDEAPITDQAIARLLKLPRLRWLHLSDTKVTDLGIEQLKTLRSLELLTLRNTGLTQTVHDSLLAENRGMTIKWDGADRQRAVAARLLDKGATLAVADREPELPLITGLRASNALPPGRVIVKEVDLSTGADFGDEDLKQLVALDEIESLSLVSANVSPAGIVHLQGLTTLKTLTLPARRMSPAVIEAFEVALPQCRIVFREPVDAEVAHEVLRRGGRATVVGSQGTESIEASAPEDLPAETYSLRAIELAHGKGLDLATLAKLRELAALELLDLAGTDVTDAELAHLAGCKSLHSLTLSDTKITAEGVAALARLPALRQLYLARTSLGADGVRRAANLPGLTHLSLQGVPVADGQVALLKRLEHLQWLDLSSTPITDAARGPLAELSNLQSLNIQGTSLSDAAVESLAAVFGPSRVIFDPPDPERLAARWIIERKGTVVLATGPLNNLRDLPAGPCQIVSVSLGQLVSLHPDDIVKHLSACTRLKEIDLRGTRLADEELRVLSGLADLETLSLAEMTISDRALLHLAPLAKLQSLDLSRTHITGSGLAYLSRATELRRLSLSYCPVRGGHLAVLAAFPKLQTLDLSANSSSEPLTDEDLNHLVHLSELKILGLRSAKITSAALDRVAKLGELESLDLEGTSITDQGVEKLAGLSRLSRLSLTRTSVTDGITPTLARMKSLRSLALKQTSISPESIRALQTALGPSCTIAAPTPRESGRIGSQFGPISQSSRFLPAETEFDAGR